MDVTELLSFKPDVPGGAKRKGLLDSAAVQQKRHRVAAATISGEMLEEEAAAIDDTSVRQLILKFEKRVTRNQEMRIKYPDNPERFIDSEVELNEVIQEMHMIATVPEYYSFITDLNTVPSLLQLLTHENTDISLAVVDLLQELTEVDTLNEHVEGADHLLDALLEGQLTPILIQHANRLDPGTSKEEEAGVYNSLAIVENIVEYRPECSHDIAAQGLLIWLLSRIKQKAFDANKLYCSEILAILVQDNDETRELVGELDGIDILLQQLNSYKRRDPDSNEEFECMENMFDCLCSSLMYFPNKIRFMHGEGLQLMDLLLREKRQSRNSAIKVLDYAMTGPNGQELCQKFVDIRGLRSLFPLFMKTPKVNKKGLSSRQLEEHIISIIASMVKTCAGNQKQRLLQKFVENDHEKVERLLELHFKYLEKVRIQDRRIESEKRMLEEFDEDKDDEFFMRRLDAGLFVLQNIDYIMVFASADGDPTIKSKVMRILSMRGESIKAIKGIMRDYANSIGETADEKLREEEQNKVLNLLSKFTSDR